MSRLLSLTIILSLGTLSCGLAVLGCGPPRYVEPALSEPHATLTLRLIHHEASGPQLNLRARLNGYGIALAPLERGVAGAPVTRTVRVRPAQVNLGFSSHFFHRITRMETVWENERYSCGTQQTGYGTSQRTTTRYCNRRVSRTRPRTVVINDGSCETSIAVIPTAGRRYVIQYDYNGRSSCRARCFERVATTNGAFELNPCRPGPAGGAPPAH